jgi:HlyD family secretion protein
MKWLKRALLIGFGVAVLAAIVYGFLPRPQVVELATASRGDLQVTIDEEGRTRVKDRFTLFAPVPGNLARITLRAGDAVTAGQTLATLHPFALAPLDARARAESGARVEAASARLESAAAAVTAAHAQHEFAAGEHARLQRLLPDRISQEAVDAARTRETSAAAALQSARFQQRASEFELQMARAALIDRDDHGARDALEIHAPVSGAVLRVMRESEGAVAAGEPLIEIGDLASLEVIADLLSRQAVRVRPGMNALIERWGGEGALRGRVRLVEPSGFTKISALGVEEQRVNLLLDFEDGQEGRQDLGDGFRVELRIIISERHNALKVPAGAAFSVPGGHAVFAVESGRARQRRVRIGERTGLEVEVLDGLKEGERVIVHPADSITDGVAVTTRE